MCLCLVRNQQPLLQRQQEPKPGPSLVWLLPKLPWKRDNRQLRKRWLQRMLGTVRMTPSQTVRNYNHEQSSQRQSRESLMKAVSRWRVQSKHQVMKECAADDTFTPVNNCLSQFCCICRFGEEINSSQRCRSTSGFFLYQLCDTKEGHTEVTCLGSNPCTDKCVLSCSLQPHSCCHASHPR